MYIFTIPRMGFGWGGPRMGFTSHGRTPHGRTFAWGGPRGASHGRSEGPRMGEP